MSAIPNLKKKLKSVRATGKLSKALKTVSAAKFSRLSAFHKNYRRYAAQFRFLLAEGRAREDVHAETVLVLGSNRGFCGGFNSELIAYLCETVLSADPPEHLIACGEELCRLLCENGIPAERTFTFSDVPDFSECEPLFAFLSELAGKRKNYAVRIVRPFYRNTLTQVPEQELLLLHPTEPPAAEDCLWLPERATVLADLVEKAGRALLFGAMLETALGAQAATLMTMRSAYDTATEYTENLEGEIHRLRQSEVTADVIETASERGSKGENA